MAVLVAALVVLAGSASRNSPLIVPPPPSTATIAPTIVEARLPADGTVPARVGELVRVHVQATTSDIAESRALGVSTPVGPQLDAPLLFVADRPGRFRIDLRYAAQPVGHVDVAPR